MSLTFNIVLQVHYAGRHDGATVTMATVTLATFRPAKILAKRGTWQGRACVPATVKAGFRVAKRSLRPRVTV